MFQERPFRQQRHSFWSIWWFVGLMASGLTAWHLELLPFLTPIPAELALLEEVAEETSPLLEPLAEWGTPATFEPAANLHPMPSQQEPHSPEPASLIEQVSYQQNVLEKEARSQEFPVQTLTYRADLQPVHAEPIPPAQGLPPVQTASYSVYRDTAAMPVEQTVLPAAVVPAGSSLQDSTFLPGNPATQYSIPQDYQQQAAAPLSKPAPATPLNSEPLAPEVEQDILRLRDLSSQYWKQEELRINGNQELRSLAQKIYFQPDTHYLPSYEVQPGDQLRLIARDYQVSWQYLARLNRMEPEKIRAGQKLKVMKGPFHAVVDLSDRTLTVHAHGYFMCSFPVGTGREELTPTGEFPVINKVENPTYYGAEGVISADDPRNPLGEHWIDLGNSIGIHGTLDPNSIGHAVSKGCVRMHADDVAMVYDLLTTDSIVIIRP